MNLLESIPEKLGITDSWVEKGGVHWLNPGATNVRDLAKLMNSLEARFVTITAYQLPGDEGYRLEYVWDLDGQLMCFPFQLTGNSIDSIYDLCEAVDWIEREVHEGFTVDFIGREYEPLQVRPGDNIGFNLREEGK
jgi:hypothetical protein